MTDSYVQKYVSLYERCLQTAKDLQHAVKSLEPATDPDARQIAKNHLDRLLRGDNRQLDRLEILSHIISADSGLQEKFSSQYKVPVDAVPGELALRLVELDNTFLNAGMPALEADVQTYIGVRTQTINQTS